MSRATLLTGARIRVPVPRRLTPHEVYLHIRGAGPDWEDDGEGNYVPVEPEATPWQAMIEAAALAGAL